jgi:lipopolysaccharide export system protein LptA
MKKKRLGCFPLISFFYQTHYYFLVMCLCFCASVGKAQNPLPPSQGQAAPPATVDKDLVQVDYSDRLQYIQTGGKIYQKLLGNVKLHQDSVFMYCDSAIITDRNIVHAYSRVIIQQGRKISCFSDSMTYNGQSKIADLYAAEDVVLVHEKEKLFTNKHLNYNLSTKVATYNQGAILSDDKTKLRSKEGEYFADSHEAFFKTNVEVLDKEFTLKTDTLQFNTETRMAIFLAPTRIHQKEDTRIYCERGYYNFQEKNGEFVRNPQYQKKEQRAIADTIRYDGKANRVRMIGNAFFQDSTQTATAQIIDHNDSTNVTFLSGDAHIKTKTQDIKGQEITYSKKEERFSTKGRSKIIDEKNELEADAVNYDKLLGYGVADGNVVWSDTAQHTTIKAPHLVYNKKTDYVKASGGRPLLITLLDKDSLFMTADTLISYKDTISKDTNRMLRAYHDVRIFKSDLQSICDSLVYNSSDSLFRFFKKPIIWSDTSQFTADTMQIQLAGGKIDRINLYNKGFITTALEKQRFFNQIKGKNVTAFFKKGEINRMKVVENVETIYYAQDSKKAYIGVNKITCARMLMQWSDENKISDIRFYSKPTGNMTPMKQADHEALRLEGFSWQLSKQPKSLKDLF